MRFFSWDYVIATITLFLMVLLIPLMFSISFLEPMKNSIYDFRLSDIIDSQIIPREHIDVDTNMILINTHIGHAQISNKAYLYILAKLSKYEPKVIAIKSILKESNNPEIDFKLAQMINLNSNIVLAKKFTNYNDENEEFDSLIVPDEIFSNSAETAFVNFTKQKEEKFKTIREFMPFLVNNNNKYKSFAYSIVEKYDEKAAKYLKTRNNDYEFINYKGKYNFFRIEAMDAIKENFAPDMVKNKIVILGRISTRNKLDSSMVIEDVYFSPLNNTYMGKAFPDMYGTVLQANIISMVLDKTYINAMPFIVKVIITVLIAYVNMIIFTYIVIRNKKWYEILSLLVFVVESIMILAVTIILFVYFKYDMDLTFTILVIAVSIFVFEMYYNSLKPLTIKLYYKYIHKG